MVYNDINTTLQNVVNTESGKYLLKYLKESYLLSSAIKPTVEQTYYELGKRELILGLISLLENPIDLDNIQIKR